MVDVGRDNALWADDIPDADIEALVLIPPTSHDMKIKSDTTGELECVKCWLCTCHNSQELRRKCEPAVVPPRNNVAPKIIDIRDFLKGL